MLLIGCTSDVPVTEFVNTPVPEITVPAPSRVPDSAVEDNPIFSSPAPTATTKPPPTPTPALVDTAIPVTLDPVATAARILPLSWSPDSEMLAYWTFTDEEVALDFTLPPGTLNFFNVSTGESCQSTVDVGYGYLSPTLAWLPEGRVRVLVEQQGAMEGTPCQDDFNVTDESQNNAITDPSLSPGGDYQVNTIEIEPARFRTTLTNETTGELLAIVDWQTIAALGAPGLGGQWLRPDEFLIHQSINGPLLVSITGGIIPAASQIFNQSVEAICDPATCETTLAALGANAENSDVYHLVLYGKGVETNFPSIHLYHSENDLVEVLDYKQQGGFSPDGQTLLLLTTKFTEKLEYTLALRAVDPPASQIFPLLTSTAINPLPVVWSPDSKMLAASSSNDIILFSKFGEVITKWDVARWATTMPTAWSPNSQHLAIRGLSSSANTLSEEALFVVLVQES